MGMGYDGARGAGPTVESLRFGGQFMVWAIRLWLAGRTGQAGAGRLLDDGFALADLHGARARLDAALLCLAAAAERPIQFNRLRDPVIADDEVLLLRGLAALQIGAGETARQLFEGLLPAAGARTMLGLAKALADALSLAGLHLWSDPSGRIAALAGRIGDRPSHAPGLARLH